MDNVMHALDLPGADIASLAALLLVLTIAVLLAATVPPARLWVVLVTSLVLFASLASLAVPVLLLLGAR